MQILGKFLNLRIGDEGGVPVEVIFGRIVSGIVLLAIGSTMLIMDAFYHMGGWLYRAFDVVLIMLGVLLIKELLDFTRSCYVEKADRSRVAPRAKPQSKTVEPAPQERDEFEEV